MASANAAVATAAATGGHPRAPAESAGRTGPNDQGRSTGPREGGPPLQRWKDGSAVDLRGP